MRVKKFLICLPLMLDISIKRINLYIVNLLLLFKFYIFHCLKVIYMKIKCYDFYDNLIKHELKNKKIKEY